MKEKEEMKNKIEKVKGKFKVAFEEYTGHSSKCLSSMDAFVEFMFKPTDAASLGVGRMLFGEKIKGTYGHV